jgi:hypothetical protein
VDKIGSSATVWKAGLRLATLQISHSTCSSSKVAGKSSDQRCQADLLAHPANSRPPKMSYPGFQGYTGNYGSVNNTGTAYDARRSSSAAPPPSTSTAYPVSSSQQQYGSAAYAWPDRSQSSYGNMNGNPQHYGSTGWKDGQSQQPLYDYQRPQTNYVASSSSTDPHGWYGTHTIPQTQPQAQPSTISQTQPQAQPSTQALSNLAYASGLGAQEQHSQGDRRAAHACSGSQQLHPTQRDVSTQEKMQSPAYDQRYTSSNATTSQNFRTEQSPTSAHHALAVSAAAALAGAVNRRYNSSPQHAIVSTQQHHQPSAPLVANAAQQNSENAAANQNQQWLTSRHDTNARSQLQTQVQPFPGAHVQHQNLSRYETTNTHRYAHANTSNVTLPLPTTSAALQPRSSHVLHPQNAHGSAGEGYSPEKAGSSSLGPSAKNSIEVSHAVSLQQQPEPAPSMPTFIDPSQVFNPYHKEHEWQNREEVERARRASTEALSEQSLGSRVNQASTNPPVRAADTVMASTGKQQGFVSVTADKGVMPSSRSSSMSAESKELVDVEMAAELRTMMHRLREFKSKDPSLFQKLWGDMKKGGGSTQATTVQTPVQSPQLAQAAPQQPGESQTSQFNQPQQPEQLQPCPAPRTQSNMQNSPTDTASKASSSSKRHWDLTMATDVGEERLPDLCRFPAERRKRRAKQVPEAQASGKAVKQTTQIPSTIPTSGAKPETSKALSPSAIHVQAQAQANSTIPPAMATQTAPPTQATPLKQDIELTWTTQSTSQPTTATDVVSMGPSKKTLLPVSKKGNTIWPEAKRKALAEAAQKALLGLPANKGKSISIADIHTLLEQNPSYIELCENLEGRGFVFHRGQFARYLLNNVPDLSSPSQSQPKPPEGSGAFNASPAQPPQHEVSSELATHPPTTNGSSTAYGHPPTQPSSYIKQHPTTAPPKKTTVNRVANSRLGVPSPIIPTPVPGSKEANARKRDFSELVDLTQLSDDEDYVMPTKQAKYEASPEKEVHQVLSDTQKPPNVTKDIFNIQQLRSGPSDANSYGPPSGMSSTSIGPQGSMSVSQLQSHVPAQVSQGMPQRSRHLLARRLNKAEALRKSFYDPTTVARDVLIAAGRHPLEHPLNAHLAGLLGKHVDIDSDLSTFDWDSVDPGGPPMPVVQVVEIPAGPPRWRLGQRPNLLGPVMGTSAPPSKARREEAARESEQKTAVGDGTPVRHVSKEPASKESGSKRSDSQKPGPHKSRSGLAVDPALARLRAETKSLLDSFKAHAKPSPQPTRPRLYQQAEEDSAPPARLSSRRDSTPHRQSGTSTPSITSTSPNPQLSHKRARGRLRKSSIVKPLSPIMDGASSQLPKRRGRPLHHPSKQPSAYMLKKAATMSAVQVAIPARRRSTSSPQYDIYACEWYNCDAKLHNLPTLRKHIAKVHKPLDDEITSEEHPCWWKNCRTLEHRDEETKPKVTFNSTSDWLDHIESDHLHPIGMQLGDGPSSVQTGKPKPFEVSKYFYHRRHPSPPPPPPPPSLSRSRSAMRLPPPSKHARTKSHTDPQTLDRDRHQGYLCDHDGRLVTAASTPATIRHYPADTLILSAVTMDPESNIPSRAFSKAHDNEKMNLQQSATETLVAMQRHKETIGPGLDRGGCTLVNPDRGATLVHDAGLMRVVDANY